MTKRFPDCAILVEINVFNKILKTPITHRNKTYCACLSLAKVSAVIACNDPLIDTLADDASVCLRNHCKLDLEGRERCSGLGIIFGGKSYSYPTGQLAG